MEENGNIVVTEEMKREEADLLGEGKEAMEQTEEKKAEIVSMDGKKAKSVNYTHTFKKPVMIMGQQYKTLTFYFDKLSGADIEAVEEEMMDMNKYALSPELSSTFQCMLAARAAGIGSDELRRLPAQDYMKIKNKVRDFLADVG